MKLSKQQRIEAYELAAERVFSSKPFICVNLTEYFNTLTGKDCTCNKVMPHFPEANLFLDGGGFPFYDFPVQERIESRLFILGSCILFAEEAEE